MTWDYVVVTFLHSPINNCNNGVVTVNSMLTVAEKEAFSFLRLAYAALIEERLLTEIRTDCWCERFIDQNSTKPPHDM